MNSLRRIRLSWKHRKLFRRTIYFLSICAAVLFFGRIGIHCVPLPDALFAAPRQEVELFDRTGRSLRSVRPDDSPRRQVVEYSELPQTLIQATCAAEDSRFWQHSGVDWRACARAFGQLLIHRRVVSGGSTITQQLIKLSQPRPRTFTTKLIEALQALRLEQVWTKQQILTAYLNRLDYGNFNRGSAAAAQFYFGKPLRDLSPAECALLAGLPQAPSRLNPLTHRDRAIKRQLWVLDRMRANGWLADADSNRAQSETLRITRNHPVFEAPHFVDLVLAREAAGREPRDIQTTLSLELNHFAEATLRRQLTRLDSQHVSNGAVVIIDNKSGDVLALVGSGDYFAPAAGQVNGAWSPRSPGSALKPFTYLLALERGDTPATIVADIPTEYATATGIFAPVNYDHRCYGPTRYRIALANSLNISAVNVLASLGGPRALQTRLAECGISTLARPPETYGLGLTLGNADVRLLELANAYAGLARLGEFKPYRLCRNLPTPARRVAYPEAAWLIADILSDNDARTATFGTDSPLHFDFPVACKTGTSTDFRDNWALGFTPEFTVGVWVGNFDGSPMEHVSGVTGAGPVLHELFAHLHERYGTTWYPTPTNIVECWINPITGKQIEPGGASQLSGAVKEHFLRTSLPPYQSFTDHLGKIVLGSEYREWLASSENWLGDRAVCATATEVPHIIFPLPGTLVYLDNDLPSSGRLIHLRASGPDNLEWRSDSLQFETRNTQRYAILAAGRHDLIARDPISGKEARTWLQVVAR